MNLRAIQNLFRKRPFDPFQIVLSSGDRYRVDHPENCVFLKEGLFLAYSSSPKGRLPGDFALPSYLHIAGAEPAKRNRTK